KLHDIRDRKIGGKKPDCAHDARSLTYSASCAAVDERCEHNQTENREIFRCDRFTPALAAEVIVRIENIALHVQVPRKNHQPSVVTSARSIRVPRTAADQFSVNPFSARATGSWRNSAYAPNTSAQQTIVVIFTFLSLSLAKARMWTRKISIQIQAISREQSASTPASAARG